MKKILLTIALSNCFILLANATHNSGGEITLKQLGYLHYEATIHTYTKASSLPADRDSLEICWGDGICEWISRDIDSIIDCGIKYNTYTYEHTYAFEGYYFISMTDPNRNGGIINIPISDNVPFHIQTELVANQILNSTPIFFNPPTDVGKIGGSFSHNLGAVDLENDSLSYEIAVSLIGLNEEIPNFSFPSQIIPGPNNSISIDPEKGTLLWESPQMAGVYNISIKVREHRGTDILSVISRDFNIEIYDSPDLEPNFDMIDSEVTLEVGDNFTFNVEGLHPSNGAVKFESFGFPYLTNDPATFTAPTDFTSAPVNGIFEWTITNEHYFLDPYYVIFRIEENENNNDDCGSTNYHVLKININEPPNALIEVENQLDIDIYPNPVSSDLLNIKIRNVDKSSDGIISIYSLDGKILLEEEILKSESSKTLNLQSLPEGNYLTRIQFGEQIKSKLIQVIK